MFIERKKSYGRKGKHADDSFFFVLISWEPETKLHTNMLLPHTHHLCDMVIVDAIVYIFFFKMLRMITLKLIVAEICIQYSISEYGHIATSSKVIFMLHSDLGFGVLCRRTFVSLLASGH